MAHFGSIVVYWRHVLYNKEISFKISLLSLTFLVPVDEGHLEGCVSQIFYLGPSFYFIRKRKLN